MQILWTCVVEYARTKGCQSVGCMVFPDNQEMRAVGERFGKLRSLVYEFKV
jgi:RimJ/RimL family protein N-acetyltransferase